MYYSYEVYISCLDDLDVENCAENDENDNNDNKDLILV